MNETKKPPSNKLAFSILFGSFIIAVSLIVSSAMNFIWGQQSPPGDPKKVYENITYVKTTNSPFLGNPDARVEIIEYIDFECPICKKVYDDIYPQIKKDYIDTGKVKFIFKSLPIEELHKTAFKKTEAALCAYDQGGSAAFFTYHDTLFNNFPMYNIVDLPAALTTLAVQNNLDPVKFQNCLTAEKYKSFINKDIVESLAIDAKGTPTWLIGKPKGDGIADPVKLNGLFKYSVYTTILDQMLSEK